MTENQPSECISQQYVEQQVHYEFSNTSLPAPPTDFTPLPTSNTDTKGNEVQMTQEQSEYEIAGGYLAILSKEDMKSIFSTDAPLNVQCISNVFISIFPQQICVYEYSPQSQQYTLQVFLFYFILYM